MPALYIVATPIGNLEDLTLRALRVLREVDLIAAEDTRVTRKLLSRYDIGTRLVSYHEHNSARRLPELLEALTSGDVALVSDAGTPGVNDPGSELVSAAAAAGFPVVPLPGASAVTTALAVSGLPVGQFVYLGFLPRKRGERTRLLGPLTNERRTLLAFEAPHRLRGALRDILDTLGDRRIAVCRELTKLHEEVFRGTVAEALEHFGEPRGELTLVIEGGQGEPDDGPDREASARTLLVRARADGALVKDAVARAVRETGLSRRAAYRLWLETKGQAQSTE
jgi:16S rRNA (cytidine1402-2'-O)-methyltransferase